MKKNIAWIVIYYVALTAFAAITVIMNILRS